MGKKIQSKNIDPMSNPREMGREGLRLIKNMGFGKFDFSRDSKYFKNREFILSTINEIDKRIRDLSVHISAIQRAYPNTNEVAVTTVLERDLKSYEAYMMIRENLERILMTGDIGFLYVLINKLPRYKYSI